MPTLGDSETIMVLPFGPHTVQYRDDLPRWVDDMVSLYYLQDSVHAANIV